MSENNDTTDDEVEQVEGDWHDFTVSDDTEEVEIVAERDGKEFVATFELKEVTGEEFDEIVANCMVVKSKDDIRLDNAKYRRRMLAAKTVDCSIGADNINKFLAGATRSVTKQIDKHIPDAITPEEIEAALGN